MRRGFCWEGNKEGGGRGEGGESQKGKNLSLSGIGLGLGLGLSRLRPSCSLSGIAILSLYFLPSSDPLLSDPLISSDLRLEPSVQPGVQLGVDPLLPSGTEPAVEPGTLAARRIS